MKYGLVSFYRLGNLIGRIIPVILGKGWRFPGIGPSAPFGSSMVSLGTLLASMGVSLSLLICYNQCILRIKVWWKLTTILDPFGSNSLCCPPAFVLICFSHV